MKIRTTITIGLVLFAGIYQIPQAMAEADLVQKFLSGCPYMCLPEEMFDDNKLDPAMSGYTEMVLGCAQLIDFQDVKNFMSQHFSGSQSWGMTFPDSLQVIWPGVATIPFRHPASKFAGLYSRMYYQVSKKADEEAKKIVASQSGLNETEVSQIMSGSIAPLLQKGMKIEDAYAEQKRIENQYKEEKTIMDIAADLKGEIVPTELFSNGTIEDSGYDLIVDLNVMEKILFKRDDPLDAGMVQGDQGDKKSSELSTKVIEVDEYEKTLEQCQAIKQDKVSTQSTGEVKKVAVAKTAAAKSGTVSEPILTAQANESNNAASTDPATCTAESQAINSAVESYFQENSANEEVQEIEEDFKEAEQERKEKESGAVSEDEGDDAEESVTVNGETMTKEEYQDLQEKCAKLEDKEENEKNGNLIDEFDDSVVDNIVDAWKNQDIDSFEAALDTKERDYFRCAKKDSDDAEKKGIEFEASVCIDISLENGTVTPFAKEDNCIACHVDNIIKNLEEVLNVNFMSDKIPGNILEPNICKMAIPKTASLVHISTKSILTPKPKDLAAKSKWGVNFEEFAKTVQRGPLWDRTKDLGYRVYSAASGGEYTPDERYGDELAEDYGLDFSLERRAANLVFSKGPANMTLDESTKQISDIIAAERAASEDRLEKFKEAKKIANRSQFGQALELELTDMLTSFQSMNAVLKDIQDVSCKKMQGISPVP